MSLDALLCNYYLLNFLFIFPCETSNPSSTFGPQSLFCLVIASHHGLRRGDARTEVRLGSPYPRVTPCPSSHGIPTSLSHRPEIDDSASASPDGPSPSDIVPKSGTDSKGKNKPASAKPKSTKARAKSRPHRRLPRPRRPHYRQYVSKSNSAVPRNMRWTWPHSPRRPDSGPQHHPRR